MFVCCECFV